jgi:hypothetical protein
VQRYGKIRNQNSGHPVKTVPCYCDGNLLLGEVLAAGEVVGELAAAELDGVGAREVGAAGGQPLLVVQLLITPQM